MLEADKLLEDEELIELVYEAQGERHEHSSTRGRSQNAPEMALRLLLLKHLRNWSFDTLEREVTMNLAYRDFTRIGLGKVPDAKTLARIAQRWAMRANGFASGTLPNPMRVKSRYAEFIVTSRSSVSKLQFRRCFNNNSRKAIGGRIRSDPSCCCARDARPAFVYQLDELFVFQKLVGFQHPGLPKSTHIFVQYAFPQCRLTLLTSSHALS